MFRLSRGPFAAVALFVAAAGAGLSGHVFAPVSPPLGAGESARAREARTPAERERHLAGPYRAEAARAIDGDTFEARVRIWFNQDVTVLVRLEGVDAPELAGRCEQETRLAREARDALGAILASGDVFLRDLRGGKYNGRAVARVSVRDRAGAFTDDVSALMLAGGYARPYAGRARASWCARTAAVLAGESGDR